MQEAIEDAVSGSDRVAEIVADMQRSGYDLCLILDSTVTVSPTSDCPKPAVQEPQHVAEGQLTLTLKDLAFLQDLKISIQA